jgi:hypothetical protein
MAITVLHNKECIMHWAIKSLIPIFCFSPVFLMLNYYKSHNGVLGEAFFVWYFIGLVIALPFLTVRYTGATFSDYALTPPLVVALVLGLTLGALGNIFLAQALTESPNPSFPLAIYNGTPAVLYVATLLMPQFFAGAHFSWQKFLGIALTIIGATLVV